MGHKVTANDRGITSVYYLDQKRNCPHNIIDNNFTILAYSYE